jgi:hypothetical protein
METLVEADDLVTVNNFAKMCDITAAFVYKLQSAGKLNFVMVDGVAFVNKKEHQSFADKKSTGKAIKKLKSLIKSKKNEQKHNSTT